MYDGMPNAFYLEDKLSKHTFMLRFWACVTIMAAFGTTLPAAEPLVVENSIYRIAIDRLTGAIISLIVKPLDCEMIGEPRLSTNFRLCLPIENYQCNYIDGMRQKIASIERHDQAVTVAFTGMISDKGNYKIDLSYTISIEGDEVRFRSKLVNHDKHAISEFWFPRLGGWTKFGGDRMAAIALPGYGGCGHGIMPFKHYPGSQGLGAEAAEWSVDYPGLVMPWWSMKAAGQDKSLYMGYHDKTFRQSTWHTYLFPTASGGNSGDVWITPEQAGGQPVGLVFSHVRYPFIAGGETFDTGEFILRVHDGDWHQAARYYRKWFTSQWAVDKRDHWLRQESAWFTSIIFQPEDRIIADFDTYAKWTADAQKYGVNAFELIGWHKGGLERGYPIYVPEPVIGGADGFNRCIETIHKNGGKVMPFVNYNILDSALPEYKTQFKHLAHQDCFGSTPNWMAWGESTLIARKSWSVRRHLLGSVVPELERLLEGYFVDLIKAGADGLQIDKVVVSSGLDFNPLNKLKPDEALNQGLVDAIERLYRKGREINPRFCLASEALPDRLVPYIDVYYRAAGGRDISPLRYAFPEWTSCYHISAPRDFDGVNAAVMLGAVICVEPYSYQGSMADPLYADLAAYIAETQRIRKEYRDTIFTGDYLDMTQANVIEVSITPKPNVTTKPSNNYTISPETHTLTGIGSGQMFWRVHAHPETGRHAIIIINCSAQERYYSWNFLHKDVTSATLIEPFQPDRELAGKTNAVKIGPNLFQIVLER